MNLIPNDLITKLEKSGEDIAAIRDSIDKTNDLLQKILDALTA